ncbi:MAG: leucine-rich repeat domain-containing protein [Bacteroidaceae bacterium]|nr:leucine-rich repeat domain-containing protein [Bacteroidaceae bacterium]
MKKIYQLSLAAALLLSPTFAATSFAQTLMGESWSTGTSFEMPTGVDGASAYVSYKLKGAQAIVTGMNMSYTSVKIPASFTYAGTKYTVVGIADGAFKTTDGQKITSITLPSTITTIGNNAFYNCKLLTSITLPSSLQKIGTNAFYNNDGLKSLTIPASVTTINANAFYECDYIASLTFSGTSQCKTIGDNAFGYIGYQAPIASVSIPNSVTSLGQNVFTGAKIKSLTLGTGITTLPSLALSTSTYFKDNLTSITMNGVQTIPDNSFKSFSKLQAALMPKAVTIGASAFESTGLLAVTVPSTVKNIGTKAFANCASLKSVKFLMSSGTVGVDAFLNLSSSATVTAEYTDYFAVDYQGYHANPAYYTGGVKNTSGNWMTFSAMPSRIGSYAFGYNIYNNSTIPGKNIKTIADYAFASSKNETIDLTGATNVKVGLGSFYNSAVKTITNSSAIVSIDEAAFQNASSLTAFDFSNITSVPNYAFMACTNLATLTNVGKITTIGNQAFYRTAENAEFSNFTSLTSIGMKAFAENKKLTGVTFNSKLTTIGEEAFAGCTAIPYVSFVKVLQPVTVGKEAFKGCTNIASLTIPPLSTYCKFDYKNGQSNPLWDAYNAGVATVIKTNSATITDLVIPGTITRVNDFCFGHNTNIKTLKLEENVQQIGYSSFNSSKALTTITLPSTLTMVGNYGLSNLEKLTSITCGATSVPTAYDNTFSGITYANVTLNVPADTKSKYAAATGWSNFASKTVQTCDPVEISTLNGKLVFKCKTAGASILYNIQKYYSDTTNYSAGTVSTNGEVTTSLTPYYKIQAWATKSGHANSPVSSQTVNLGVSTVAGDANGDGVANIADVTYVVNKVLGK